MKGKNSKKEAGRERGRAADRRGWLSIGKRKPHLGAGRRAAAGTDGTVGGRAGVRVCVRARGCEWIDSREGGGGAVAMSRRRVLIDRAGPKFLQTHDAMHAE